MAKEVKIELVEPITGHEGQIRHVVLREPNAADCWELGEPFVVARNPDGAVYAVENDVTIKRYIERCVVSPNTLLLGRLGLADALAVKAALLDFFTKARSTPPSNGRETATVSPLQSPPALKS
jgi:hypothetical protein